ncbi:hypothetical protein GCM10010840_25450 [Deinococcus aerolatus]|uniref:Uncharacterized protein n=1 Tax=Deinococcus aerolatus TaxID=522487 RepID=A0ABQ2GD27_9DEIO|nr:hypothetical protein GCM10010840_25450 [Deinococcus aerolatus]
MRQRLNQATELRPVLRANKLQEAPVEQVTPVKAEQVFCGLIDALDVRVGAEGKTGCRRVFIQRVLKTVFALQRRDRELKFLILRGQFGPVNLQFVAQGGSGPPVPE